MSCHWTDCSWTGCATPVATPACSPPPSGTAANQIVFYVDVCE
ncbi:MAG TPA: hypothetical protein VMV05_03685 [bacterium]|nr:hypothetical protein [bacterium]